LNPHGNVDIRHGVPETGVHVEELPLPEAALGAARVAYGEALVDFCLGERGRWQPEFRGWVIERNWEQKVADRQADVDTVLAKIEKETRRGATQKAAREEEKRIRRSEAAKRAAKTRKKNRILSQTVYGQFLLAIESSQEASNIAKSRAADGIHFGDYQGFDGSDYSRANYRRSREAREKDYLKKALALDEACKLAQQAGIQFGWSRESDDSHVPWVVYFDLPTGQVGFHSNSRGKGPDYPGEWDGVSGVSAERIQSAIRKALSN